MVLSDPDGRIISPDNGFDPTTFDVHIVNIVPEPSTYVLFSFGLLGLGFLIKRKRMSG
ncbi:MAG: PEP-CTERM sorting domain-containing protein [Desulfobacterium sp.]|nr:PEP-CTERM sorting domain-containing protein [Desulfobacterium sp.]